MGELRQTGVSFRQSYRIGLGQELARDRLPETLAVGAGLDGSEEQERQRCEGEMKV